MPMSEIRKKVIIALGFFDSIHLGHQKVLSKAIELSKELNCVPMVFSFDGNLKKFTQDGDDKIIYSTLERKQILFEYGIEEVYFAPVTKEFLSLSPKEFLDLLNEKYNVSGYVSGEDYRFGSGATGNVEFLKEYARQNGQVAKIQPLLLTDNSQKISTTFIKQQINNGNIALVNKLLNRRFSISGTVIHDRGVGGSIGVKTANILYPAEKEKLKFGVYSGTVLLFGKQYRSVINYGARPTFSEEKIALEAHLSDYNGKDFYGEQITIYFDKYIRENIKFNSKEELLKQIEKDGAEAFNND